MRKAILKKIIKFLKKYNNFSEFESIAMEYGLEGTIIFFEKFIVVFILSIYLGIIYEMFVFMIFFIIIKTFSGGIHTKTSSGCLIASCLIFVFIPFVSRFIIIPRIVKTISSFIFFMIFAIYSPADTHKKPIKKNRNILKILSLIIIDFLCIFCILLENSIGTLLYLCILTQSFLITPIPYKIINVSYANWRE